MVTWKGYYRRKEGVESEGGNAIAVGHHCIKEVARELTQKDTSGGCN